MSHQLDMSNNRANVAYRGDKPWHKLGFQIAPNDPPEVIAQKAGLNFTIKKSAVRFVDELDGVVHNAGTELSRDVLYRDDTKAALSIMSTGYKLVQPVEIMDFIASSAKSMGWQIETAGSLRGGRNVWALAKTGDEADVGKGDRLKSYLLASTSCDGSSASDFLFTSVSVVCWNTLQQALGADADKAKPRVKVYHNTTLDVKAVKEALGIATSVWARFIEQAKTLASVRVSDKRAMTVLRAVFEREEKEVEGEVLTDAQFIEGNATARRVLELYQGQGIGMDLKSRKGTAWGLVNATTEYFDHAKKSRSTDNRLASAWFGSGAERKQKVADLLLA